MDRNAITGAEALKLPGETREISSENKYIRKRVNTKGLVWEMEAPSNNSNNSNGLLLDTY